MVRDRRRAVVLLWTLDTERRPIGVPRDRPTIPPGGAPNEDPEGTLRPRRRSVIRCGEIDYIARLVYTFCHNHLPRAGV